jgi:predicted porin
MSKTRTTLLAATSALVLVAAGARADDYTDLLNILRAKGSLTAGEYRTLMAKHMHHGRYRGGTAPEEPGMEPSEMSARQAAAQAAASAAAAQQAAAQMQAEMTKTEAMMASPDIIHAMPYKPGAGVTMKVGTVDINISAIVNAFYTFSSGGSSSGGPLGGTTVASGFDSSSVRNGLLPGALIISAATQQDGIDLTAVFGMYPGIDSSNVGFLNANNGGNATALGTAGVDFRKTYITFGTPDLGTVKMGRDIGLFGQDAILNDQTLLGVGATGGNADPGNTSLGRIGVGYIYADFMPQITYISPVFAGFQASLGVFQPLNEFNATGTDPITGLGASGSAGGHTTPMFEGRLTYDYKDGDAWSAHLWAGFVEQDQQNILAGDGLPAATTSRAAVGGEAGGVLTVGPVGLTAYYYRARGVGTTGLMFDGIGENGELRDSEGGYIQAMVKPTAKLKLVGSYGISALYLAPGEVNPDLVRRNEGEVGGVYYSWTDWLTMVGEFAHTNSKSHDGLNSAANSVSLGAILFY